MIQRKPRIGCLILLIVGLGIFFLFLYGYRVLIGSLPSTKGNLTVAGLNAEVKVYRDGYSIPCVFAQNERDLFFAQGYVTAQDRLWQMDLMRRTAGGRLSEIFGTQTLGTDSLMRSVGIHRAAKTCSAGLSEKSRLLLQAYTDGINAYITSHQKHIPVESLLLNYQIDPWTVEDCIAVYRLFAWQSDPLWLTEPLKILLFLRNEKSGNQWTALGRGHYSWNNNFYNPAETLLRKLNDALEEHILSKPALGGFVFAVPGERMDTGRPVLVHVPCSSLSIPTLWYQIDLRAGNFQVTGLSIPGFPMVFSGHNGRIAWAPADLYAEDLNFSPALLRVKSNGDVDCLFGKSWGKSELLEETILFSADSSIRMRIPMTDRGPVVCWNPAGSDIPVRAVALKWKGLEPADEALALYRLNLAGNRRDLEDAFAGISVPNRIWVYADGSGNAGVWVPNHDSRMTRIVGKSQIVSATDGRLAVGNDFFSLSSDFPLDFRIRRLQSMLLQKGTLSNMDLKQVLTDAVSPYALRLLKTLLPILKKVRWNDSLEIQALQILSAWNGEMKPGSAAAAIYETLFERLVFNAFHDTMDEPAYALFVNLPSLYLPLALQTVESGYVDRILFEKSFRETVAQIQKTCGNDASQWNWGTLHTLTLDHPLGGRKLLKDLFNAGSFPMGKSATTIDCWEHPLRQPFEVNAGPSARLIVDLGNLDNSVSVIISGQSGQSMDVHYRDQIQLFLDDCYHPDLWDDAKIRQSGWSLLVLQPENKDE
jgi:penicillin amidase